MLLVHVRRAPDKDKQIQTIILRFNMSRPFVLVCFFGLLVWYLNLRWHLSAALTVIRCAGSW
jgi:hypothetical protein